MDGPETVIVLSAVARNSDTDFAMGSLKITFSGGWSGPPKEHHSGSLSTAGLSNSPPSLGLPHPKV